MSFSSSFIVHTSAFSLSCPSKFILASRPQVNLADNAGRTALMYAAARGHKDNAKLILSAGADAAQTDKGGKTAYDIAQENRHDDTARSLKPKKPKDKN